MKDLLIFDIDFNELDPQEGRYVVASRDRDHVSSSRVPTVGEIVWLRDSEGIECPGSVHSVRQRTVLVEPEWDLAMSVPQTHIPSGYTPSNTKVTINTPVVTS